MGVTIKKIADLCGVSRGTVDRVLNHRGNVKKETEEKILRIAKELNYTHTTAKSAYTKSKRVIGVVLAAEGVSFFDDILKGINSAYKELADYGLELEVRTMKGYDPKEQIALIEEIENKISALILNPINHISIEHKINSLTERGKAVATLNTDIEGSKRLFYVGSNYVKGGEIACGMLSMITGGSANIGILSASERHLGHQRRIQGFKQVCQKSCPNFNVIAEAQTDDDEIQAYQMTEKMLKEYPEINALYIAGAGVYGACRAVIAMGREKNFNVMCFDRVPGTVEMMEKGLIKATICQQPITQGNKCVHTMFSYLISGNKPEKAQYIVKNEIRIEQNI